MGTEISLICDSRTTANIRQLIKDGNLREGSECILKRATKEITTKKFDVIYVFSKNVEIGHLPTGFVEQVNNDPTYKYKYFTIKSICGTSDGFDIVLQYIKISSVSPGFEGVQPYDSSTNSTLNVATTKSTPVSSSTSSKYETKSSSSPTSNHSIAYKSEYISPQKGQSTMTQNYTKQFEKFIEQLTNDICKTVLRDALSKFQQELSNSTNILNKCVSATSTQLNKALENNQEVFSKEADGVLTLLTQTVSAFDKTLVDSAESFKVTSNDCAKKIDNTVCDLISTFEKSTSASAKQFDGDLTNAISKIESSTGEFIDDFDHLTQKLKYVNDELSIAAENISNSTEALPELTKAITANTEYCSAALDKLAEQESDLGKIIKANYDAALELYANDIESHFKLAIASYSEEVKNITNAQLTTFEALLKKAFDNSNSDTTKAFQKLEEQWEKKIELLNKSFEERTVKLTAQTADILEKKATEISSISKNQANNLQQQLQNFIKEINPNEKFNKFTADMEGMQKSVQNFTQNNLHYVNESRRSIESFISQIKTAFNKFNASNEVKKIGKINKLAIAILIFQIINFAGLLGLAYLLLTHMGILNI